MPGGGSVAAIALRSMAPIASVRRVRPAEASAGLRGVFASSLLWRSRPLRVYTGARRRLGGAVFFRAAAARSAAAQRARATPVDQRSRCGWTRGGIDRGPPARTDRPSKLSVRRSRALDARFGEEARTNAEALRCFAGIQEDVGSGLFARSRSHWPGVANRRRMASAATGSPQIVTGMSVSVTLARPRMSSLRQSPRSGPSAVCRPCRNVEKGVGSGCPCHGRSSDLR